MSNRYKNIPDCDVQFRLERMERLNAFENLDRYDINGKENGHYTNRVYLRKRQQDLKGAHRQGSLGEDEECIFT